MEGKLFPFIKHRPGSTTHSFICVVYADNLVVSLYNSHFAHFAMAPTISLQYTRAEEDTPNTRDWVQLTKPLSLLELRQGSTQKGPSITALPFGTKTDAMT
jgi:hypothetical protein